MKSILLPLKGALIAIVALAMSASLAFAAPMAPAAGYALGSTLQAGDTETAGDEDVDQNVDTETDESTDAGSESADNCLTDPTGLTPEELAAMSHGSIVCWAAQQETPDGYANHGAFVSEWAHAGKDKAANATGKSHGKAKGLTKGN